MVRILRRIRDLEQRQLLAADWTTKEGRVLLRAGEWISQHAAACYPTASTYVWIQENTSEERLFLGQSPFIELKREPVSSVMKCVFEAIECSKRYPPLSTLLLADLLTFSHSIHVSYYVVGMAIQMNMSPEVLVKIGIGAFFHDIGKLQISRSILNKRGPLTSEEYRTIQQHPLIGLDMMKEYALSDIVASCILGHHERMNGSGYPHQKKGEQLDVFARMMAIVDVFEALTSHRPYAKAMEPARAIDFLEKGKGTQFDAELLPYFYRSLKLYPEGTTVQLNTGETGVVLTCYEEWPCRPSIEIRELPDARPIAPFIVHLREDSTRWIERGIE